MAKPIKFYKEEFHRGKWQPLRGDDDVQLHSKISQETADIMNANCENTKIRYVAKSEKPKKKVENDGDIEAVRAEYEKVVGKKPFHGWDEAKLKAKIAENAK